MNINKTIAVALACLLVAGSAYSQDADIKKVIANESESFAKKDLAAWESTWVQDATAAHVLISGEGYYTTSGWDSIKARAARHFAHPLFDITNTATDSFSIRREGNLAIVDFKQTVTTSSMAPFNQFVTLEHRELMKKSGQWKIVKLVRTDLTIYGKYGFETR